MSDDVLMKVDEFIPLLDESVDRELIRGRLREWPRRFHTPAHAILMTTFNSLLCLWRETQPRPRPGLYAHGAAHLLRRDPDTLMGADVSVASAEQRAVTPRDQFYIDGPPILAVEILEPWDTHGDIVERIREYLDAGTVVWEVAPQIETIRVHQPGQLAVSFNTSQEFSADPYLPGFRVAVAAIFED